MIITIELDRIWSEDKLDEYIIKQLAIEIKNKLMKKHEEVFMKELGKVVQDEVKTFVNKIAKEKVNKLLNETDANIGWPINTNEPMTLENHLINAVKQSVGNHNSWKQYFDGIGEKVRKELKERYDKEFAATIVDSMVKNNMLKDDVLKMIMKKS